MYVYFHIHINVVVSDNIKYAVNINVCFVFNLHTLTSIDNNNMKKVHYLKHYCIKFQTTKKCIILIITASNSRPQISWSPLAMISWPVSCRCRRGRDWTGWCLVWWNGSARQLFRPSAVQTWTVAVAWVRVGSKLQTRFAEWSDLHIWLDVSFHEEAGLRLHR